MGSGLGGIFSYQLLESRSQNLAVKVEDFAVFSLSLFLLKNCFFSYTLLIYYYREGVKSAVIPTLFLNLGLAQTQNFIFCPEKFGKLGFCDLDIARSDYPKPLLRGIDRIPIHQNEPERKGGTYYPVALIFPKQAHCQLICYDT